MDGKRHAFLPPNLSPVLRSMTSPKQVLSRYLEQPDHSTGHNCRPRGTGLSLYPLRAEHQGLKTNRSKLYFRHLTVT